jgi:hypothetical protein
MRRPHLVPALLLLILTLCCTAGCKKSPSRIAFLPAGEGYERVVLDPAPVIPSPVPLKADLDADGLPEAVIWEGERVWVDRDGQVVWQTEPEWRVVDVVCGDVEDDLRQELLLALWKDDPNGNLRSHPHIAGHRHGRYDLLWGGSAAFSPIHELDLGDVDGDGRTELVVLEGDAGASYEEVAGQPAHFVTVWRWNGWGFTLFWRSERGDYRNLHLIDLDSDEIPEIVVEQQ